MVAIDGLPNVEPVLGLKLNKPNPPLLPGMALVELKADVVSGAEPPLALGAPKENAEADGAEVELGVGCGLPKEKPTCAVELLGEVPEVPKPKVEVDFGDAAAAAPKEKGFDGVEVLAADVPKEKPENGLGAAGLSLLSTSALDLLSAGTVSTCRNGEGCRALLLVPGKNGAAEPERLFEADFPFATGSGESLSLSWAGVADAAGKAKADLSPLDSAFEGLKMKPPGVELSLGGATARVGSGLKVLPAKLNTVGGTGGAGAFAAAESGV